MSTCRSCGAEIVWAITEAGKRIPLDAEPERRFVLTTDLATNDQTARSTATYISHFATCPNAAEHRRS